MDLTDLKLTTLLLQKICLGEKKTDKSKLFKGHWRRPPPGCHAHLAEHLLPCARGRRGPSSQRASSRTRRRRRQTGNVMDDAGSTPRRFLTQPCGQKCHIFGPGRVGAAARQSRTPGFTRANARPSRAPAPDSCTGEPWSQRSIGVDLSFYK